MTKTFTTALVLRQVEAGRLSLDRPAPRIPGLRARGYAARITVRHLLEHRSGLVEYTAAPGYDPTHPMGARRAIELALAAGLQARPGARVFYSNTNFLYLGLVLEQVTGRPYPDLLAELIEAEGLDRTRLGPGGPGWPGFSSGGVISTLRDLARWGDRLFTPDRILPAARVRQLTTIGERNTALSMWPLCPCGTGDDGVKRYTAIGQTVGNGGLIRFPSGMTLILRANRNLDRLDATLVSLGQELQRALRASAAQRS